jgi:hypothetical protein
MKISDFIFQYNTFSPNPAICRIRIFFTTSQEVVVLATDLGNQNTGASVTNSVEDLIKELVKKGLVIEQAKLVEHYEKASYDASTFDLVDIQKDGSPKWQRLGSSQILKLLDCEADELEDQTSANQRLYEDIQIIRNSIDPFIDSPYPENAEIIKRRLIIMKNMTTKRDLIKLILNNAKELELQAFLRNDLSILAEAYAHPNDEYICFSEFPIADGFVDFAIFTGRSRMDVILIEIKGADYDLVNNDSYRSFSAKTNTAVQQIRRRVGDIYENLTGFKKQVHKIRHAVESGENLYSSFIGPYPKLSVDPDKDVNIRGVVIGGRSKDDYEESRLRQEFEWGMTPPIKIESWDSWLKKIRRI